MSKRNDSILKVLHVVSWIIFIGLCIESGALIFNFIYSLFRPIATHNLYNGLDLAELFQTQYLNYIGVMSFVCVLSILKAYLFFLVIKIFQNLNLTKPFTVEIAKLIQKISYETISIAIVGLIAAQYTKKLLHAGYELGHVEDFWNDSAAFLMMASILFVISQVFNKGIEIQNENDLTV